MISLEEPNYNFKPVHFICDGTLGDHIKEPFPNRSFFWAIVGRPGSGKTSLLINCLTEKKHNRVYNKVFDKIIYVCPINSRKSIKDNPFDDLPEDQKFESFNENVVKKIEEIRDEFDKDKVMDVNKIEKKKVKGNKRKIKINY
jgi:KaiC/GvpD/RAD55 family RecA-like ATPase